MISDGFWALNVLVNGDNTRGMKVVYDDGSEP